MQNIEVTLVETLSECGDFLYWIDNLEDHVAIDTETVGLEIWKPGFKCRLVAFGTADRAYVVPNEWYGKVIAEALAKIATRHDLQVVFHNAPYDIHVLREAGLPPVREDQVQDTNLIHRLTDPASYHSLKGIAGELLGPDAKKGQGFLKALFDKHHWNWRTVPLDHPIYWGYAGIDVILTSRIYEKLNPPSVASELEHAYQNVMIRATARGMLIDMEYTKNLATEWRSDCEALREKIEANYGVKNPGSNAMVEAALREMAWTPTEFTDKSGQAKLDKEVYERIIEFGGPKGELAEMIVEYKRKRKWVSTYLDHFLESGGVSHPGINTMEAKTGRTSITSPPMQTLPGTPHIRNCVVPAKGFDLWAIDYQNQEYRIASAYAGEQRMIDFFNGDDPDYHSYVGRMLYGDDFTKEQRAKVKTYNFASLYRAGPATLAKKAGVTEVEMHSLIADYNREFPAIRRFFQKVDNTAKQRLREDRGAFTTTLGGRRVEVNHEDEIYCLTNYIIQGSGADVLKQAVIRLDAAGLADYIVIPVHDELLFQLPKEGGQALAEQIAEIMTDRTSLTVPLTVDITGPLTSWGQAYEREE